MLGTISRIANYDGFSGSTTGLPLVNGIPQSQFRDPFPAGRNPLVPVVGRGFGVNTNLGGAATFAAQNYQPGINDRLNFSLQRQLPGQFKGDFTYFINIGRNMEYTRDLNQIDPRYRFGSEAAFYSQATTNPFFGISAPDKFPGQLRGQRTVARRSCSALSAVLGHFAAVHPGHRQPLSGVADSHAAGVCQRTKHSLRL